MHISLSRKNQFFIHSILVSTLIYYYFVVLETRGVVHYFLLGLLLVIGVYITNRPNINIRNILLSSILHILLLVGFILSLLYFPNLSTNFRILIMLLFGILFYMISLVNNVFLVVQHRKETIPLYRVALTWGKILLVVVAIPTFGGVFKLSINSVYQTLLTMAVSVFIFIYLIWSLKYSQDIKKFRVEELVTVIFICTAFVGMSNLAVSFFPTESFLKSLFVSSVVIFCLSYIEGHFKNSINKALISEHLIISTIFLLIMLIFNS